jgi:hypothetical protein
MSVHRFSLLLITIPIAIIGFSLNVMDFFSKRSLSTTLGIDTAFADAPPVTQGIVVEGQGSQGDAQGTSQGAPQGTGCEGTAPEGTTGCT